MSREAIWPFRFACIFTCTRCVLPSYTQGRLCTGTVCSSVMPPGPMASTGCLRGPYLPGGEVQSAVTKHIAGHDDSTDYPVVLVTLTCGSGHI